MSDPDLDIATPTPLTPEQMLLQLKTKVDQLEKDNTDIQVTINEAYAKLETKNIKLDAPEKYRGEKEVLSGFLTQIKSYLRYYNSIFTSEAAKTRFAASRLKDKALQWFELTLKNYLDYTKDDDRDDFTIEVFEKYSKFEEEIKKVFGHVDEKLHAQERLGQLRQTKSTSIYATLFRQDSLRAEMDDKGLIHLFYNGLNKGRR